MPGSVQCKVPCVFKTRVIEEKSNKRQYQQYNVVASNELQDSAIEDSIEEATPTEKLDGTCVYVHEYKGRPWLWARLDRKPTKQADKHFKRYQAAKRAWMLNGMSGEEPMWNWNADKDFRTARDSWIPAKGVPIINGTAQPDLYGHIPGWLPVESKDRQYCWHSSTFDVNYGIAVVLKSSNDGNQYSMEVTIVELSELLEQTLELIGTNINGNPYGLGCKRNPIHVLVPHGVIQFPSSIPISYDELKLWFESSDEGKVEGIVWHCKNQQLYKLHRHHFGLPWPIEDVYFTSRPVAINMDLSRYECDFDSTSMFSVLSQFNGQRFEQLRNVPQDTQTGS
ncbi:RNA ligase 1-like [Saccoglossus kowalevskii]|uniref:RNA ligase 1 n=1 Tax=Saccoglossus kowalevskii TaxID=10224 RepID=A0ABM0GZD8_SACKO|nr:PREDICTED: uncharacterized protein C12orf29 homolog [Saccoglossus kowalevskii]